MSRFRSRVEVHRSARHHDYEPQPHRIIAAAAPGDQARARAIPILGPLAGGGAIPGSRPDHHHIRVRRTP